jgi:hypothetical protein
VPRPEGVETPERAPFAYAVIRVVPRVEREEFVNAGVVLFSRPRKFLGARAGIDRDRLRALWPDLDLEAVQRQLDILCLVAAGDRAGGAIARLPAAERFGWLSAPASTIVQPGPVHAGLAADPEAVLEELFAALVVSRRPGNAGFASPDREDD